MAMAWEAADGLPHEIEALFDNGAELLLGIPEHKVPLPGGRRESQTDLFTLIGDRRGTHAVSIEGKVDEPFGPTVGEWLRDTSAGKIERMAFLCNRLGIGDPPSASICYQLLHRTVSAPFEADRFKTDRTAMIVHSFSPSRMWLADFQALARITGLTGDVEPDRMSWLQVPGGRRLGLGSACGDASCCGMESQ